MIETLECGNVTTKHRNSKKFHMLVGLVRHFCKGAGKRFARAGSSLSHCSKAFEETFELVHSIIYSTIVSGKVHHCELCFSVIHCPEIGVFWKAFISHGDSNIKT